MPPSSSPGEPHLPPFNLENVEYRHGRQDKIDLVIWGWRVEVDNQEEAEVFLEKIGGPPTVYANGTQTGIKQATLGLHGRVFNRFSRSRFKNPIYLNVRIAPMKLEDGAIIPPPLIGHRSVWNFKLGPRPHLTCRLELSINPTRLLRHLPMAHTMARPGRPGFNAQRMFNTETGDADYGELSTDGKDNWLPDTARFQSVANTKWDRVLRNYLQAIVQLFEDELRRAHVALHCGWSPQSRYLYQLKSVESYWDLYHEDPFRMVESLEEMVNEFAGVTESTYYEKPQGIVSVLRAKPKKGVTLKLYAKTDRRVRLEVTHTLTGNERLELERPRVEGVRQTTSGSFVRHGWDETATLIHELQGHALGTVNEFLTHVRERRVLKISSYSPYDMLLAFQNALPPGSKYGKTILTTLILEGEISPPRGTMQDLRASVKRLLGVGILRRIRPNVFVPHKDYLHAFRALRKLGARSLLRPKPRPRPRFPNP